MMIKADTGYRSESAILNPMLQSAKIMSEYVARGGGNILAEKVVRMLTEILEKNHDETKRYYPRRRLWH